MSRLLPPDVSTFGADIDHVFWLIFWIVGVWFIVAEGALFYAMLRYRRKPNTPAQFLHGNSARQMAWVLIPAVVVLFLDLGIDHAGARAWELVKLDLPPATTLIQVGGKQFNWIFTYPGPDGKFGTADDVTVENELHVPVGQVVRFELSSTDVIHSFFVPELRLKQDAVPGRIIRGWFEVTAPGTYEIACSELCGFGHYTMHGSLIVQNAKDYEAWVSETWPKKTASNASASLTKLR